MDHLLRVCVPSLGESVHEATVAKWYKKVGDFVGENDLLLELETEKITLDIYAPSSGVVCELHRLAHDVVEVGDVLATINTQKKEDDPLPDSTPIEDSVDHDDHPSSSSLIYHQPLTPLRQKIAKRLKEVQQTTASLTTFNEIDLHVIDEIRTHYQEDFEKTYGAKLSYTVFFAYACSRLLMKWPIMNAHLQEQDIVFHRYCHLGIAISVEEGIVVPAIKNAHLMSLAQIALSIKELSEKARSKSLKPSQLKGGTFSITNGGVFGSLFSTPIINPGQSAILGMHSVQKRPVVINDAIHIRPMMYVALSYDHRIIDGKQSITFLKILKERMEHPYYEWLFDQKI